MPAGFGILESNLTPPIEPVLGQLSWIPVNKGGIVFDSLKQQAQPLSLVETFGYTEDLSEDGSWTVTRTYFCNWSDALASMQWLRGFSVAVNNGISRIIPAQDPYRPWMYCIKAELIEAMGVPLQDPGMPIPATIWAEKSYAAGQTIFSDGVAKIRATFRAVPYVIRNDIQQANAADSLTQGELGRYVERVPRYAIQGIPLLNIAKQGQLFFVGTNTLVPEAGLLLMPTQSWHYIWHDVPFYPSAAIQTVVGKVNAFPFDGIAGWPLFPAGTLLCQAPEIRMKRNCTGGAAFDVTWILDFRPQGWNNFPVAPGTGVPNVVNGFAPATFAGKLPALDGSNQVFRPANFTQLFLASGNPILFV